MAGRIRAAFCRGGRRTNVALLIVLVGAFLSGWAAFAAGTDVPSRVTTIGHGLLGLGVAALTPWKTVVARRAPVQRLASLGLAAVIVVCLIAGFAEVFAGYRLVAGISPIQVHVGAAFVAVPLLVWHLLRHQDRSRGKLISAGASCCGPRSSSRRSGPGMPHWRELGGWPGCPPRGGSPAGRIGSHPAPFPPRSGCWTGCLG